MRIDNDGRLCDSPRFCGAVDSLICDPSELITGDKQQRSNRQAGGLVFRDARIFFWPKESNIATMGYASASRIDCAGVSQEK